jgi:hypothetical protein
MAFEGPRPHLVILYKKRITQALIRIKTR